MPIDPMKEPVDAIAIVGIGGLFPGSETLERFWANVLDSVDATSDVPAGRWLIDPAQAFDPRIALADHVHSIRGGFVPTPNVVLDGLDLDRSLLDRLDPLFHLALHVARQAWCDARTGQVDRNRVGVVFGNIVLPTETASALSREILGAVFEEQLGVSTPEPGSIEPLNAFPAGMPAALVARALRLGGGAFTLDAACGSSLYALKLAVDELRSGRADAMLSGGVSRPDPLYTQMGFSQLRALSARGRPAPFDHRGDGLVVGEGAGMFVLKRLEDALKQDDQIYGLVAGIGLSNDIHGDLLAPSSEGQLRAMRMAYEQAGWGPGDVDLVECHAPGTPVGDAVEIESLKLLREGIAWRQHQCAIGSVKSNIGHTLTAAGAAGLLKVLLALKHRRLPPTANFERSGPHLGLENSPFRVLSQPEPWPARAPEQPRRAAVSGFGFGGVNAHVLIEEWAPRRTDDQAGPGPSRRPTCTRPHNEDHSAPVAIVSMSAHFGPFQGRQAFQERVLGAEDRHRPTAPRNWWGATETAWYRRQGWDDHSFPGFYLEALDVRVGQFRIPPKELGEMLPQQSLMLHVAAEAILDAGFDPSLALRTGVLIGIGLDLNSTNFHLRWSLPDRAHEWNRTLGLGLSPRDLDRWVEELLRAAGPALSANRTMGSLGGLIASRIAREFQIGGPSFTVSCDETSGIQAMAIAVDWLRRRELDAAVVGAVDFAGDLRAVMARHRLPLEPVETNARDPSPIACDGAVCLVLKRLEDAKRNQDRIYATIREVKSRSAWILGEPGGYDQGSIQRDLGHAGASTGLAEIAKTALCLAQQILPTPNGPQFWLRNRAEGPRRATVRASSLSGNHELVILEEAARTEPRPPGIAVESSQPLGARPLALFAIEADDEVGIIERIKELGRMARTSSAANIDALARQWWRPHPNDPQLRLGLAVVASGLESLMQHLDVASREVLSQETRDVLDRSGHRGESIHFRRQRTPRSVPRRVALVYPGLGSYFAGMGRELSALWPDVLRAQDSKNEYLRDQFEPETWWNGDLPGTFPDHRIPILGQVSVGSLVTDLLRGLGVVPDAAIGYSLGETAALLALGAWTDRDGMASRLRSSPLFQTELAGPCNAARRVWAMPPGEPVDWVAGIVTCSPDALREAIVRKSRVYVLITNTDRETVIGGFRRSVEEVVNALRCPFIELPTVSTVHCEIGRVVEADYRALHDLETITPSGVEFYSGVWGRPYAVDRRSAADAIAAQATGHIDFRAVVERAYHDGVRVFLEVGPGSSCTRLIGEVLGQRPHLACSACRPDRDPLANILDVLGELIAHRVPVDLTSLYGQDDGQIGSIVRSDDDERRNLRILVRGRAFQVPALPSRSTPIATSMAARSVSDELSPLSRALADTERATAEAHSAFLRVTQDAADMIGKQLAFQLKLIEERNGIARIPRRPVPNPVRLAFDRPKCLEFAVGSVAAVLGEDFAAVDGYPTRVRLPDEPLMLVDGILTIEGRRRSLDCGRVVTEHLIREGAWYLDGDRIAPCIAIEAGQADLVLSAYLGVDFATKGLAVYRLLDATVTFHRGLPVADEMIRYDIRITRFFRQGKTILFQFQFDATVQGEPLLTMRDGCAGFFTAEELAAGKGIVSRGLDIRSRRTTGADDPSRVSAPMVPMSPTLFDERQVDALRNGDLMTAFGSPFDRLELDEPLTLPVGRMALVHRVVTLDPTGGSFKAGLIRAEAEIHPGDWFMVCHFVDDRVMPGTLMYECCLHTLRIFLLRMGWIGPRGQVAFEPVPGVANRLKCRGQITESTQVVTYEVTIKELGYRPEPYAIADALIYAGGKPIVEITDMALQLSGTNRQELERLWAGTRPAVFSHAQVLAFAVGKPSDAFGDRYQAFDDGRFISRLPGPPYQFLDRIVRVEAEPWIMVAGGSAEAEYDILPDAWFFAADRQDRMPLALLLEVALQACGWLAAYMGSALTNDHDMKFRNLGGTARQHRPITRQTGTLTTRVKVTKIASTAGMIIQNYDFTLHSRDGLVYDGSTEFGFFHPRLLLEQVGIRDAAPYEIKAEEQARAQTFAMPSDPPFPDLRLRMIDQVDFLVLDGGPQGLGVARGSTRVDPEAWFFKAHFLNDPVWPGSLGLESLLQLLKIVAASRWGVNPGSVFESPALEQAHHWTYRGQIVPANRHVTVQAEIKVRDDRRRKIVADGYLDADGRTIYQMKDFSVCLADG
jgi:acyl transferase domain-containing protein/3-hydroxymyristoyl/3-hydroxydecanoyl-(acyl carrier protein) dehydratase